MNDARPRRVFISYAHKSATHVEAVRQLWMLLRANGVDARLDLPASEQRQDWPLWIMEQFRSADYVVVVASAEYQRRVDGGAGPAEGRGVQFEGALLREKYYEDRGTWTRKVLPVILPGESVDGIPSFLGPTSTMTYRIEDLSQAGIEDLIRVITHQPTHVVAPLGPVPALPPRDTADTGAGAHPPATRHSHVDELRTLADAFAQLPEFATTPSRHQLLLLLPPNIRTAVNDAPNARLHIISMLQGCARFGEAGRTALLDILRAALPVEDKQVRDTITLIASTRLFDNP